MAGISAAISAARQGLQVILCNDRATLGGNSSSEFRVWISGANGLGSNRYAEEGGIVGELTLESLYRNKEGNPYLWDMTLLDFIIKEKNIKLLQNARVTAVTVSNGQIRSASVSQYVTETEYEITAPLFADCTGDGYLSVLAGARWVHGSADEIPHGDSPFVVEDREYSLGSTIFFYKKLCDKAVRYIPPDFAYRCDDIEKIIRETGKIVSLDMDGCDYWWIEYGGGLDSIKDSEEIQYELLRIVYGLWDYIKNSGRFAAEYYTLEWVGALPGRRESRRILAQNTLTTKDVYEQREYEDAVTYGGWPIDIHPSSGFFDTRNSCNQIDIGVYSIPLGCLLNKDLNNLLLAGRNAGMTHGAMASARVMKTCALMGQAVGTAAAFATARRTLPKEFDKTCIRDLQQKLLKDDVWLISIPNQDPLDLAKTAQVSASESLDFSAPLNGGWLPMSEPLCVIVPPLPDNTTVRFPVRQEQPGSIAVEVFSSSKLQNHDLATRIAELILRPDENGWIALSAPWGSYNTIFRFPSCPNSCLGLSVVELPGALGVVSSNAKGYRVFRPAIRTEGGFQPFSASNLTDGYNRPLGHMHLWASPLHSGEAFVELTLATPTNVGEVHLYFDCSLFREFNNLRPTSSNPEWDEMPPNLARDLTIEFLGDEVPKQVRVQENRRRHLVVLSDAEAVRSVRVVIHSSWGGHIAAIYEARIYER